MFFVMFYFMFDVFLLCFILHFIFQAFQVSTFSGVKCTTFAASARLLVWAHLDSSGKTLFVSDLNPFFESKTHLDSSGLTWAHLAIYFNLRSLLDQRSNNSSGLIWTHLDSSGKTFV